MMKKAIKRPEGCEKRVSRLQRGAELAVEQQFTEALDYFYQSLSIETHSYEKEAECHYWIGECKYALNEFEESLDAYSKAIEMVSDNSQFYFDRGYLLSKLKHHDEAMADFTKCIELNDEYAWAFFHRGWNAYYLNDYKIAILDFRQALALELESTCKEENHSTTVHNIKQWLVEALKALSRSHTKERKYDQALENIDEMLTYFPDKVKFILMKASVYTDLRMYEEALDEYTLAHDLDPRNTSVLLNRAYVFYKLKYFEQAISDYSLVLDLNPRCDEAPVGIEKVKLARQRHVLFRKASVCKEKDISIVCVPQPEEAA